MMHMGFAEVLMLALMSGGIGDTDLVALVQPAHYFKSRQIEISIDRAMDYATDDPKTAKSQIVQLTSLRYLADEADALKKSAKYAAHRQTLEAIAAGKKAADPLGFAQDYARRVLQRLDDSRPEAVKAKPIREHGLAWFPANVTLAGAIDLQPARAGMSSPLKDLLKLLPDREKDKMYEALEKSGNIRAERIAFAYADGAGKGQGDGRIYMRFTGKGNQEWMLDAFKMLEGGNGRMQVARSKDEKEVPIITLQAPNSPPVVMMVGNTDFLVVGHERRGNDKDLADDVLAIRAGKKANANTGPLKDHHARVPANAIGFLIGSPPEEMKRELGFVFNPIPSNVVAFIERAQQGLDVQASTTMANRDDADKLVQKIGGLRKEGIAALQQELKNPQPPGGPPIPFQSLVNLLDSLQVQSKGENVQVRVVVPDGLIQQLTNGFMLFGMARDLPPPPPKCD